MADITPNKIADALDCFWNPAVGAIQNASYHGPASGADIVGAIAQGLSAVAARLREGNPPSNAIDLDSIKEFIQDCAANKGEVHVASVRSKRAINLLHMIIESQKGHK